MLVMILRFIYRPYFSALLRIWVNRDAGKKRPAVLIWDYNRAAGNKWPAISSLVALMNCIPGFKTAEMKELLLKLQIPAVEEVPGLSMSEAVEVSSS